MKIESIPVFNCSESGEDIIIRDVGFDGTGKVLGLVFPYPDIIPTNTIFTTCPHLRKEGIFEHVRYTFTKDSTIDDNKYKGCKIICTGCYCERRG